MCTVTPLITLPVKIKYTQSGFKLTALGAVPCKTHSYVTIPLYSCCTHRAGIIHVKNIHRGKMNFCVFNR